MKKFLLLLLFTFLSFPLISHADSISDENTTISEVDKKIYEEKTSLFEGNSEKKSTEKYSLSSEKNIFTETTLESPEQNLQKLSTEPAERTIESFSPELITNGNFELGNTAWAASYKYSDGYWYDDDSVISADSGGYDSWYAYLTERNLLESKPFTVPINTTALNITYSARLVSWGTCAYGSNGVRVLVWDETTDLPVQDLLAHNPATDPYDSVYRIRALQTTIPMQSSVGHKFSLNFVCRRE